MIAMEPVVEMPDPVAQGERLTVVEILGEGRTLKKVIEVAENASEWAADIDRAVLQAARDAQMTTALVAADSIACKVGCTYCCHVKVDATVPEVLRIATFLRVVLPRGEFRATEKRIEKMAARVQVMDEDGRGSARLPCPLLVDGRCRVYSVRPLACWGWTSMDAAKCKAYYLRPSEHSDVTVYLPRRDVMISVWKGLQLGLQDAGLDGDGFELVSALHIALKTDNAAERWMDGAPIFAPARLGLGRGIIRHEMARALGVDPEDLKL